MTESANSRTGSLEVDTTLLAVIDLQEGFRPAVLDFDSTSASASRLVQAANILKLPVLVTEQYPKGLGNTVTEVASHLSDAALFEKTCFSAAEVTGFSSALDESGRNHILLCGIESHVCVLQTAHDLLERGLAVHVVCDAVTSRTEANRDIGLNRMAASGAVLTSVETALFELLGGAGTDEFKAIQSLIK